MISPELQSLVVLAACLLALLALIIAVAALSRASSMRRQLNELETREELSDEHYRGLSTGMLGQSEQLSRLEHEIGRLRSRLDEVASSGDGAGAAFSQAIRMARKGCSAREIMETCGLSEIEADLVVLMHKGRAR